MKIYLRSNSATFEKFLSMQNVRFPRAIDSSVTLVHSKVNFILKRLVFVFFLPLFIYRETIARSSTGREGIESSGTTRSFILEIRREERSERRLGRGQRFQRETEASISPAERFIYNARTRVSALVH